MGYAQRFIIGTFLIVSAYQLSQNPTERYHFHLLLGKILNDSALNVGMYKWIEYYHIALDATIFIGGLMLLINCGVLLSILSQLALLFLSFVDTTRGTKLNSYQWITVNIAILVILIINYKGSSSETQNKYPIINENNFKP